MAVPEILEKWSSITYYASSPYRYNLMLFLKVMNITFLKVKNITCVLSSGGTRILLCGGHWGGKLRWGGGQKPKNLPKIADFGHFFFWWGQVGAEPLTGDKCLLRPPWWSHWFSRDKWKNSFCLLSSRVCAFNPNLPGPFWGCSVSIWSQSHFWRLGKLCI